MPATATKTAEAAAEQQVAPPRSNLPAIRGPRLPYHPMVEERFGIDRASWKALVEAIFPNATSVESVILALSYCKARRLDPFKRNVHIVPIWSKDAGGMVDTIWPGIGELRTTAFRTREYAGRDDTEYGPDITMKVGSKEVTFPEWARTTVYRMVAGQRVAFAGPRVYWLETYANYKRGDDTPNEMWADRPRGQLEKCSEAAALRAAFPEEIGSDYIPEEVQHGSGRPGLTVDPAKPGTVDELTAKLAGPYHDELPHEPVDDAYQGEHLEEINQESTPADEPPAEPTTLQRIAAQHSRGDLEILRKHLLEDVEAAGITAEEINAACDKRRAELKPKS